MSAMTMDVDAPPLEWMPGVFDEPDVDGYPMRHRPVEPWGDIWRAWCGGFCFAFRPESITLDRCLPCLACELAEAASKRSP